MTTKLIFRIPYYRCGCLGKTDNPQPEPFDIAKKSNFDLVTPGHGYSLSR